MAKREPDSAAVAEARQALCNAAAELRKVADSLKGAARPLRVAARTAPVVGEVPWSDERIVLETWVADSLEAAAIAIRERATKVARTGRKNWHAEIAKYVRRETTPKDISTGTYGINWNHRRYLSQLEKMPGYAEAAAKIKAHEAAGRYVSFAWLRIIDGRVLEIHNVRATAFERGKPSPDALPVESVRLSASTQ